MEIRNGKKILALAVAMVFTLGLGTAMAQPGLGMGFGRGNSDDGTGRSGPGHKRPDPFMGCLQQLELSEETLEAIEVLVEVDRENMQDHRDVMQEARDEYVAALTAEQRDDADLDGAQFSIIALKQEHDENRFALELAIVELLSAEEVADLGDCLTSLPPREAPPEDTETEE